MKTSFITTVLNEEKSIHSFLDSMKKQTKQPDEIVIVDGGSTDNTISKILSFKFSILKYKVKIFKKNGNRSVGRNEAIKNTTGDVILVSDAGCILDKNWVKKITEPFQYKNIDIVSGYYYPKTKTVFEKCLSTYTCVMPDKVNPEKYLPSSRSVAFKKSVWKKVGGYPEDLNTCEDLVFVNSMKNLGLKFKFQKDAYVYWPQRENIREAFLQFYNYAKGDGAAFYIRKQTPLLFFRGFVLIGMLYIAIISQTVLNIVIVAGLLVTYFIYAIIKNYRYIKDGQALFILPLLQLISDIAVSIGMTIGFITGLAKINNHELKR